MARVYWCLLLLFLPSRAFCQPVVEMISSIETANKATKNLSGAGSCAKKNVSERDVSGVCSQALTSEDKKVVDEIKREISSLPSSLTFQELNEQLKSIIAHHQDKLTVPALTQLFAEAHRKNLEKIENVFKKDDKLARAYLSFISAVDHYNAERDRWFGGTRGDPDGDMAKIKKAQSELFKALDNSAIDPRTQVTIKKSIYALLTNTYQHGTDRAMDSARHYAYVGLGVTSVGVASSAAVAFIAPAALPALGGAAGASVLTAAPTLGSVLIGTATATIAGTAGGAAFMGSLDIAKILAHASVNVPGMDFFCRVAEETIKAGNQVDQDMKSGALVGATLGGSLTALAAFAPTAAVTVNAAVATTFASFGALTTINNSIEARNLFAEAKAAVDRGDEDAAVRYLIAAKKAAIDAGLEGS